MFGRMQKTIRNPEMLIGIGKIHKRRIGQTIGTNSVRILKLRRI